MKISTGRVLVPIKTVIYGPEGIGKSTFASQFPKPIFIDTEGSTVHMANVQRVDDVNAWSDIIEACKYLRAHIIELDYQTIVIDTADWAELMCTRNVCSKLKISGIEDLGYGKGYVYLQEAFKELLDELDACRDKGFNIVITAHAKMRKFEQPDEMGSYDRWEMKLSRQVAPMIKEWADMVLFANYKTVVVTDSETKHKKAQGGGKRVMYTTHHSCWDAKNRFGLPDEMPFEFKGIAGIIGMEAKVLGPTGNSREVKEAKTEPVRPVSNDAGDEVTLAYAELKKLMNAAMITDAEVQYAVVAKKLQPEDMKVCDYPEDFIEQMLIAKWAGFKSYIEKNVKVNPFIEHYDNTNKEAKKK